MKKFFSFAMLSAIALAGAVFTSCQSDEDVQVNPTYDGESVKTAFALNVPYMEKSTRMTAETTQNEASDFRGLQDIYLFPLNAKPTGSTTFPYQNVNLSLLTPTASTSDSRSSQIYSDVNIAVGTNNFLLYAEAEHGALTTKDNKYDNGILTKTVDVSNAGTADITFTLNKVYTANETTTTENALLAILNGVAGVECVVSGSTDPTKWYNLTSSSADTKYQSLVDLYTEFTKNNRNGSGPNVLNIMQSLYNNVYYIKKSTSTTNTDVRNFCDAIMEKIDYYFDPTYDSTKDGIESTSSPGYKAECYTLVWGSVYTDLEKNFPMNTYCLPYGVAEIDFNSTTHQFSYSHNTTGISTLGSNLNLASLCYPASLQYFCDTPARANSKSGVTWPTTTTAWDNFNGTNWADWDEYVKPTTRTIALLNNVNYGVARLEAKVKCNAATLADNSTKTQATGGPGAAADINVTVPTGGFEVTGILIGGQPETVNWQFLPTSTTFNSVVYDKNLNGTGTERKIYAPVSDYGRSNYTLVLDNYTTAGTQEKVNVAIELVNNSNQDFYGYDGLIRVGQTFYLIGQLDPTSTTAGYREGSITWPTGTYADRFPANGTERVFIQDYTTVAKFNIKNLKNAYATIPDLRVAKLELGLSVDLTWRNGVTYNVDL